MKFFLVFLTILIFSCSCTNKRIDKLEYNENHAKIAAQIKGVENGVIVFGKKNNNTINQAISALTSSFSKINVYLMDIPNTKQIIASNLQKHEAIGSINVIKKGRITNSFIINKYDNDSIIINKITMLVKSNNLMDLKLKDIEQFENIIDLTKIKPENPDNSKKYSDKVIAKVKTQKLDNPIVKKYISKNYVEFDGLKNHLDYSTYNTIYPSDFDINPQIKGHGFSIRAVGNNKIPFGLSSAFEIVNDKGSIIFSDNTKGSGGFDIANDNSKRYTYIIRHNLAGDTLMYYYIIDKIDHKVYKSNSLIFSNIDHIYFSNNNGFGLYNKKYSKFYPLVLYDNRNKQVRVEKGVRLYFKNKEMLVNMNYIKKIHTTHNIKYTVDDIFENVFFSNEAFFDTEEIKYNSPLKDINDRSDYSCKTSDINNDLKQEKICLIAEVEEDNWKRDISFSISQDDGKSVYIHDDIISPNSSLGNISEITDIDGDGFKEFIISANSHGRLAYSKIYKFDKDKKQYVDYSIKKQDKLTEKLSVEFKDNFVLQFKNDKKDMFKIDVATLKVAAGEKNYKRNLIDNKFYDTNGKALLKSKKLNDIDIRNNIYDIKDGDLYLLTGIGKDSSRYPSFNEYAPRLLMKFDNQLKVESIKKYDNEISFIIFNTLS